MSNEASMSLMDRLTTGARYGLIAVTWLFALGVVGQIYLAGLSLFESAEYWPDHVDTGYTIGILAYLLPLLALGGRVGWPRGGHALVVTVLYVVQTLLPNLDAGWVAALHPLNAFVLLGGSVSLGIRTLALVRQRHRMTPRE